MARSGTYMGVDWEITDDLVLNIGKTGTTQTFTKITTTPSWPWKTSPYATSINFLGTVNGNGVHSSMFRNMYQVTTVNVTNFKTDNITDMGAMFYRCGYNTSVTSFSITGLNTWNTSNVTNMGAMFEEVGYYATTWSIGNLSNWNTSKVTNMQGMFWGAGYKATSWDIGNLSNWDVSKVTDMEYMFRAAGSYSTSININLSNWDVSNVIKIRDMFYQVGQYQATTININVSNWNLKSIYDGATYWTSYTNSSVFSEVGRNAPAIIKINVSNWKLGSKLLDFTDYFYRVGYNQATNVTIIGLDSWDTSNVIDMSHMFEQCGTVATVWNIGDLSNWNTGKVTDMSDMFSYAGKNTTNWNIGDLSNWNVSNVTNMARMFCCTGYNSTVFDIGNLSNWNTSCVLNMTRMFREAGYNSTTWNLTNLSNWNISAVNDMQYIFENAGYNASHFITLDLSKWQPNSTANLGSMFSGMRKLKTIYASRWSLSSTNEVMFTECSSLIGGNGTSFNSSNRQRNYAHPDSSSDPGYFTNPRIITIDFYKDYGIGINTMAKPNELNINTSVAVPTAIISNSGYTKKYNQGLYNPFLNNKDTTAICTKDTYGNKVASLNTYIDDNDTLVTSLKVRSYLSDGTFSGGENYLNCNIDSEGRPTYEVASPDYFRAAIGFEPTTINLGSYIAITRLTSNAGELSFMIPTGRLFPAGTTLSQLTMNILGRASNKNAAGYYIIKSASGGSSPTSFNSASSTCMSFYNANNAQKSLTKSMVTISLQGQTNICVTFVGGADFFSGTSTIRGYINNNPGSVILTNIVAYFSASYQ